MPEKVGTMACLGCGEKIPVKRGAGGALSVCCPWCDLSAYAKRGTMAYRNIEGGMVPDGPAPAAKGAPEPEPAPVPAPKPAAKPAKDKGAMPWLS